MTDFFREVDEELRNDRMRNIWKNYGKYIIAAIIFIVVATGAYRFYIYWVDQQSAVSGDQYLQALELAREGDEAGAQAILSKLEKDGYSGYPILARFKAAGIVLASGDKAQAIKAFDELAADSSIPADLRDFARLQAGVASVDLESYDAVKSALIRFSATPIHGAISHARPWHFRRGRPVILMRLRNGSRN